MTSVHYSLRFGASPFSRDKCKKCGEETLHKFDRCWHCGTKHSEQTPDWIVSQQPHVVRRSK